MYHHYTTVVGLTAAFGVPEERYVALSGTTSVLHLTLFRQVEAQPTGLHHSVSRYDSSQSWVRANGEFERWASRRSCGLTMRRGGKPLSRTPTACSSGSTPIDHTTRPAWVELISEVVEIGDAE